MKKKLTLILFSLCLINIYGQELQAPDGVYVFEKAKLTIKQSGTDVVVEQKTITDATAIDSQNIHFENAFRQVEIRNGSLVEYVLSDGQKYILDEQMRLQPAGEDKDSPQTRELDDDKYMFIMNGLPPYLTNYDGEKLIVMFAKYCFGQSDVSYTMEAELVVTMTKQNDK